MNIKSRKNLPIHRKAPALPQEKSTPYQLEVETKEISRNFKNCKSSVFSDILFIFPAIIKFGNKFVLYLPCLRL